MSEKHIILLFWFVCAKTATAQKQRHCTSVARTNIQKVQDGEFFLQLRFGQKKPVKCRDKIKMYLTLFALHL